MLNLMDFQSKRIINIIHMLANKNAQLKVSEIATMNECSDKTVYNDIKFIQNSWNNLLSIDRYNNVFVARIKSQSHVKFIFSQILANSNAIKILVAIFIKPDQSIHYYATKTNTSITNLYNTIKSINHKLEAYDIQIMNENRTFRVQASNDDHFLLFFTMIFLESEVQEQYKCTDVIKVIQNRLNKVFVDQYESIALLDFYSAYYYVCLLFIKDNKSFQNTHKIRDNQLIKEDLDFYFELKNFFPTIQNSGFNFIESKIDNLCNLKGTEDLEKQKQIKIFLAEKLKNLSDFVDEERLEKMVKIIKIIVNGFTIPDVSLPHFTNRYESFSARIQARSPETHQYLIDMFDELGQEFNLPLHQSMHYLIYWVTLTFHDVHYVRTEKILVISDHNQIHADYLKDHIKMQLGSYQYESYYLKDCTNWRDSFNENDYFRIISTNKLRTISEDKLIVIGDYISLDDLAAIFLHMGRQNQ